MRSGSNSRGGKQTTFSWPAQHIGPNAMERTKKESPQLSLGSAEQHAQTARHEGPWERSKVDRAASGIHIWVHIPGFQTRLK